MKKTKLLINAIYLLVVGLINGIGLSLLGLILCAGSNWDSFSVFLVGIGIAIVWGLCLPIILSGLMTLLHIKGKKTYYVGIVFDYIGVIAFIAGIMIFIVLDALHIFTDYYSGFINVRFEIGIILILFALFIFPLIYNRIALYKDKKNLTNKQVWHHYRIPAIIIMVIVIITSGTGLIKTIIISTNKIRVTDKNTYTYREFENELINRDPYPKTSYYSIKARDGKSKYGYEFSDNPSSNFLSKDSGRRFPFLMCNSFTAGFKWNVYYVNGEIYASPSYYAYGFSGVNSVTYQNRDKFRIVVAETEEITIYNAQKNYYSKGGGITSIESGMQRTDFPTTKDIYDSSCYKIMVVDRVDGPTLQKIANELLK